MASTLLYLAYRISLTGVGLYDIAASARWPEVYALGQAYRADFQITESALAASAVTAAWGRRVPVLSGLLARRVALGRGYRLLAGAVAIVSLSMFLLMAYLLYSGIGGWSPAEFSTFLLVRSWGIDLGTGPTSLGFVAAASFATTVLGVIIGRSNGRTFLAVLKEVVTVFAAPAVLAWTALLFATDIGQMGFYVVAVFSRFDELANISLLSNWLAFFLSITVVANVLIRSPLLSRMRRRRGLGIAVAACLLVFLTVVSASAVAQTRGVRGEPLSHQTLWITEKGSTNPRMVYNLTLNLDGAQTWRIVENLDLTVEFCYPRYLYWVETCAMVAQA